METLRAAPGIYQLQEFLLQNHPHPALHYPTLHPPSLAIYFPPTIHPASFPPFLHITPTSLTLLPSFLPPSLPLILLPPFLHYSSTLPPSVPPSPSHYCSTLPPTIPPILHTSSHRPSIRSSSIPPPCIPLFLHPIFLYPYILHSSTPYHHSSILTPTILPDLYLHSHILPSTISPPLHSFPHPSPLFLHHRPTIPQTTLPISLPPFLHPPSHDLPQSPIIHPKSSSILTFMSIPPPFTHPSLTSYPPLPSRLPFPPFHYWLSVSYMYEYLTLLVRYHSY